MGLLGNRCHARRSTGIGTVLVIAVSTWAFALTPGAGQATPPAAAQKPSLVVVGNSGVAWATELPRYVDATKMRLVDRTVAGASVRSELAVGTWAAVAAALRPGDLVLIQFSQAETRAAEPGSLPGLGDETHVVHGQAGAPDVAIHTYGWYLREYAVETIAHGATPILCAPVASVQDAAWTQAIAVQQRITYLPVGQGTAADKQAPDATSQPSADAVAREVVASFKGLREDPLRGYLLPASDAVPAYTAPSPATAPPL